ncbi:MAG: carbamate kinase [Actinomycetes bacterium]
MRVVVALGGNALLRRGEPMTVVNQRGNIKVACEAMVSVATEHELVVTHGNGPQVGLLALQGMAFAPDDAFPLDVLGAETEGMIGYLIEQELGNLLPFEKPIATVLTMTEVDPEDPAFADPTKFVGPVYDEAEARALASSKGWVVKPDGDKWRRVVPSPRPMRIFELRPIQWLLEQGAVVIAAGGGGIPTMYVPGTRTLVGVEAVVDKDLASAVLAREIRADVFVVATDADAVYLDWGTPQQKAVARAHPDALRTLPFPAGSMGPKIEAAVEFATTTGGEAWIGALDQLAGVIAGTSGTCVSTAVDGVVLRDL